MSCNINPQYWCLDLKQWVETKQRSLEMSGLHSSAKIKQRKLTVIKEALNTDRHPHFLAQHKIKQLSWGKNME